MFTTQDNKPSTTRVPAGPVLAHLGQLLAAGLTPRIIANRAGIKTHRVTKLLGDRDQPLVKPARVSPRVSEPILAVPVPDGLFVDATGPIRRLRALVRIGHGFAVIATTLSEYGLEYTGAELTHLAIGDTELVDVELAAALADLFDRWHAIPGDCALSREFGRRHRFAAPLAWSIDDDDTAGHIDDPAAQPDGLPPVVDPVWRKFKAEFVEIVAEHRQHGHYDEEIAAAMGIPLNTLSKRLYRVGLSEHRRGVGVARNAQNPQYGARYAIRLPLRYGAVTTRAERRMAAAS